MSSSFGNQVRHGAAWSFFGEVVLTASQFIIGIVLARLLGPVEFGVFIAVTAFTSLFMMGVQFGMPQAILQAKILTQAQINAAFWSICLLALIFIAIAVGIAEPLADLYQAEQFTSVMYAMCLVFVLTPYTCIGLALLRRNMRFDRVAVINMVAMFVSALVSIVAALLGAGVHSLVAGAVASMLTIFVMLLVFLDWHPSRPSWSPVRSLLGYSGFATLNNLLIFATARVDAMLVGALLGTTRLALYNRAYSLARIPAEQFAESLGPLVLGSLSRIQDDIAWSRGLYFKATSAISTLTMPLFVLLMVAGPLAIEFLYGEAWIGSGDPLRVMVVGAVFVMLSASLRSFINAQGLVRAASSVFASVLVATLMIVLALAHWGLMAIALGISLREVLQFALMLRLLGRSRIKLRLSEIGHAVAPSLIASLVSLLAGTMALHFASDAMDKQVFLLLTFISIVIFGSYTLVVLLLMWLWSSHVPLNSTRELLQQILVNAVQRTARARPVPRPGS